MKKLLILVGLVVLGAVLIYAQDPVIAQTKEEICRGIEATGGTCDEGQAESTVNNLIATIINILSFIVGVVAVIFVIWGGFKYITSGGDSSKVGSAKTTIIYAIIGLVIVALAQAIVAFVLGEATSSGGSGGSGSGDSSQQSGGGSSDGSGSSDGGSDSGGSDGGGEGNIPI